MAPQWYKQTTWSDVNDNAALLSSFRRAVRACRRVQLDELKHTGTDVAHFAYPDGNVSGTLDTNGVLTSVDGELWPSQPSLMCFLLRTALPSFGDIMRSQTDNYYWTVIHTPLGKFLLQRCCWDVDLALTRKQAYRGRLQNGVSPAGFVRMLRKWHIRALWIPTECQDANKKIRYPYGVRGS